MSTDNPNNTYFEHYLGLTTLLSEAPELRCDEYSIHLSQAHSQRFCIGMARKKSLGKLPFMAGPLLDWNWLRHIQWSRVVLDFKHKKLCLVTRKVGLQLMPTLTSIVVTWVVNEPKKLEALRRFKYLELKHYWVENDKTLQVDNSKSPWRLPVKTLQEGHDILLPDEMEATLTAHDLIQAVIKKTNVYVDPMNSTRLKSLSNISAPLTTKSSKTSS